MNNYKVKPRLSFYSRGFSVCLMLKFYPKCLAVTINNRTFAAVNDYCMDKEKYINQLSPVLFWDVDKSQLDMDTYPSFFVQRVLEYGQWSDWNIILKYYGLEKIADVCKNMRTLDPVCLSYICAITNTKKEDYRCYHTTQLNSSRNHRRS